MSAFKDFEREGVEMLVGGSIPDPSSTPCLTLPLTPGAYWADI